jgi:coenzyme Q-binding protein COQ10
MFDLVADVKRYPEFVPHCLALRVLSEGQEGQKRVLTAEMVAAYATLREKFRCTVVLDAPALSIDVDYVDGPFKRLVNRWRFVDEAGGSQVDFEIDFEFRNFLLQAAASTFFERVFARMAEAFVARADATHGAAGLVTGR